MHTPDQARELLRAKVLAALEQAAREQANSPHSFIRGSNDKWCRSDAQAVRYGPLTPFISSFIDGHITGAQLRRVLNAEVEAGRVLRDQGRTGGMIRFWPVNLWDKLQAERAAQDHVAAHVRASLSDLIGQKPSIDLVVQRVDAALQELAPPEVRFTGSSINDGVLTVEFDVSKPIGGAQ